MTNEELIAQARGLSGENYVGARPQFPTIKFMGRASKYGEAGKFYLLTKNKEGELDSIMIGDTCSVVILRVRKTLDNQEEGEARKFAYEFDSTAPGTMVTMKIGTKEPFLIGFKEAREQHPDLKYIEVLYVAYADKLAKLKVSGGSLGNLFSYLQSIPYDDTVMRYNTLLGAKEIEHPKGNYFAMTFKRGEVNPNFEKYLKSIQSIAFPTPPVAQLPAPSDPIAPPNGDEIRVEDIPF